MLKIEITKFWRSLPIFAQWVWY